MKASLRGAWPTVALEAAVAVALLVSPPALAVPVTYDLVTVGNPGNAADFTGYGAVADSYRIGKYDVTISQYTAFLNAVAATDIYSLYNPSMGTDLNIAGISRSGTSGSYTYSVMNNGGFSGNRPITYVSWFDAARFANWMQNGQGSGSTETGAYTLVGGQTSGIAPARNPGASYYIPTENEWYKAAYYSPVLNSGAGGYYQFATQSSQAPGNVVGSGTNRANYKVGGSGGIFSVTQVGNYSASQNYLTDVGAFTDSASFYGTFDQSGNVYEWTDLDGTAGSSRARWGGAWGDQMNELLSWQSRVSQDPSSEFLNIGFRLASPANSSPVPEIDPAGLGSVLALVTGALGLLERRRVKGA